VFLGVEVRPRRSQVREGRYSRAGTEAVVSSSLVDKLLSEIGMNASPTLPPFHHERSISAELKEQSSDLDVLGTNIPKG